MPFRIRPFQFSSTKLAVVLSAMLFLALLVLAWKMFSLMNGEAITPIYAILILGLMSISSLGLFIINFYITKRINTIAATIDMIMATRDLSKRIPITSRWSKLSDILNLMLADIEKLVASVRQVSDNIAHDLRTPLTRMRNRIESLNVDTMTTDDLSKLRSECDGLLATFNGLLRIAKIEAGRDHIEFSPVNLANIIQDVVELYEPLASEKSINFSYRVEPVTIMGDKDMLFQAFANLIDNAIKYTPAGGIVVVALAPRVGGATITFTDTGHGIPDAHKPHVFSRFYRVDACRNQQGLGLGLSLVAAVIALHKGKITLRDHTPNGLIITVQL